MRLRWPWVAVAATAALAPFLALLDPAKQARVAAELQGVRLHSSDPEVRRRARESLRRIGRPAIDRVYPELVASEVADCRQLRIDELAVPDEVFIAAITSLEIGGHGVRLSLAIERRLDDQPFVARCEVLVDTFETGGRTRPGRALLVTRNEGLDQAPLRSVLVLVPLEHEPLAGEVVEAVERRLSASKEIRK